MKKIDVMIVGAEKAGTTSLKNYLNDHSNVFGHSATEFTFFHNKKNEYNLGFDTVFKKYYDLRDYRNDKKIIAKNASIHTIQESIKRLHDHNPDCKLIYCVRNPVDRAYSEYTYDLSNNRIEAMDIDEIKKVVNNSDRSNRFYRNYILHSIYHIHLEMIYSIFPKNQVFIVILEELKNDPVSIMKSVFRFSDVDPNQIINTKKVYNKTSKPKNELLLKIIYFLRMNKNMNQFLRFVIPFKVYKKLGSKIVDVNRSNKNYKIIDPELNQYLKNYFEPHNSKLEKLLNRNLSIWKK